ncbi:hypothetical protein [Vibrio parahaemolyticus]|nr:hypothetical protein [Vibrio parahaemolyticus]
MDNALLDAFTLGAAFGVMVGAVIGLVFGLAVATYEWVREKHGRDS